MLLGDGATLLGAQVATENSGAAPGARERTAQKSLARLSPPGRQAPPLSAVEGFTLVDVSQRLEISPEDATALVAQAQAALRRQLSARLLIFEDEPMARSTT